MKYTSLSSYIYIYTYELIYLPWFILQLITCSVKKSWQRDCGAPKAWMLLVKALENLINKNLQIYLQYILIVS